MDQISSIESQTAQILKTEAESSSKAVVTIY